MGGSWFWVHVYIGRKSQTKKIVNVNWFWDHNTTRSIVIYVIQLNGSTITWLSKWQWIVTLLSIKVEYVEQILKVWKSPCGCKAWWGNQDFSGGKLSKFNQHHIC